MGVKKAENEEMGFEQDGERVRPGVAPGRPWALREVRRASLAMGPASRRLLAQVSMAQVCPAPSRQPLPTGHSLDCL